MTHPVVHFDYDFSPYGQKTKLLLTAAGVPYQKSDQPRVLPRPDLEALGITYRRIPLLAIGKDVYADSSLIIDTVLSKLSNTVPQTIADKAFENWGESTFSAGLALIPSEFLEPGFVKDRETVFPILARPDFKTLRPSALAAFHSRVSEVENVFLSKASASEPFIGGAKVSLADVHVIFGVRWILNELGASKEKGFGKQDFPKVWRLIENLPAVSPPEISAEQMIKTVSNAEYAEKTIQFDSGDYLGLAEGSSVTIESTDAKPGQHKQAGKLLGVSKNEVVIEVAHGIRLHFPRVGYIVRASS